MLETDNYEKFKKDILSLAKIDLNAYKEKQMRRRIRWQMIYKMMDPQGFADSKSRYADSGLRVRETYRLYTNIPPVRLLIRSRTFITINCIKM